MDTNSSQNESVVKAPHDPLLSCLLTVTRRLTKPYSAQTLVAGLPLVNHKLTPELFIRAAERGQPNAQVVKTPLDKISKNHWPTILLLN